MARLPGRVLVLVFTALGLTAPEVAQAQRPPLPGRGQQAPTQQLNATGTVQGMQGNLLKIERDGTPWIIQIQPKTEIHVVGTADVGFLQPQMFVSFEAELDKKGNTTAPLDKLTIMTPRDQFSVGVVEMSQESTFEQEDSGEVPKKGPAPITGIFKVGGKITSIKNGKMQVAAGREKVTAELAESPAITVDVAALNVVSPGDKITLKGTYRQEGQAVATEMTITLANPLTAPEPQKGRGGRAGRAARGAAEAGGDGGLFKDAK